MVRLLRKLLPSLIILALFCVGMYKAFTWKISPAFAVPGALVWPASSTTATINIATISALFLSDGKVTVTAAQLNNIGNLATKASLDDYAKTASLSDYAKTASLSDYANTASLSAYVKTTSLSNYTTTAILDSYALKANPIFSGNVTFPGGVWQTDGKVGIGTTSPQKKLDIVAASSTINNTSGNLSIIPAVNLIIPQGNVGIGTTNPSYLFDVQNTSSSVDYIGGKFLSTAAGTGESHTWVKFEKGSKYGGAIGGYISQGVGSGLLMGTQQNTDIPVERMRITNAGNVGIGTTAPASNSKLSVNGNIFIPANNVGSWDPGDGSGAGLRMGYSLTSDFGYITAHNTGVTAKNLVFQQNGGKVGIGTTGPQQKLEVAGEIRVSYSPDPANYNWETWGTPDGSGGSNSRYGIKTHVFSAADAYPLTWTSLGNVGIGTTSPSSVLELFNSTPNLTLSNPFNGSADASIIYRSGLTTPVTKGSLKFSTSPNSPYNANLTFNDLNGNAKLFVEGNTGNVGIGTTSPAYKLDVSGGSIASVRITSTDGPALWFSSTNADANARNWAIRTSDQAHGDLNIMQSNAIGGDAVSAGTSRLYIKNTGNVGIGTVSPGYKLTVNGQPGANGYTAFTNYSDARLKENVLYLGDGYLDKIMQLKPSTFRYNALSGYDKATRARTISGFIAQDLQPLFPEMIGKITINKKEYLDTNLSSLQIYLVRAIQELYKKVTDWIVRLEYKVDNNHEELNTKIDAQQKEIEELKKQIIEMKK